MTVPSSADLAAALKTLIAQRDALEAEILDLLEILKAQGNVGMTAPLVGADGFPRADVDVYTVRHTRAEVIRKRNDAKALTDRIESELHELHRVAQLERTTTIPTPQAQNESAAAAAPIPGAADHGDDAGLASLAPMARIDAVAPESPASAAGLVTGDLLLRVGRLTAVDTAPTMGGLGALGAYVQQHKNRPLAVVVRRAGPSHCTLQLTPKEWDGRGLLGCHIVPTDA
ncbi:hypothetical protein CAUPRSCDRAFT_8270 [Caulochytrium protostelioides]|uniref:Probable 26S proteasome regulatory subunit p27 n=1 Tax=Caulochytrium protostelioides TaxID=1555241 RepID=A0A4P9WYE7_9FUNG|nr:hypothetical protein CAUPRSCDRAFT_8270 [Caulochytrium protostelioides]